MAPLPENNTARYQIVYRANGHQHVTTFRYDDGGVSAPPDAIFLAALTVVLNAAATLMPTDLAYVEARYIPSGGTFSIPAGLPLLLSAGTGALNVGEAPAYLDAVGRTTGGRQARFFMLGASSTPAEDVGVLGDYRVYTSESVGVAALITALDLAPIVGIDNLIPLWKSYINVGYNAHWQKAVRP